MTFEIPKETNAGRVVEVTLGATSEQGGTRSHTITIGGSNALPFHFFEGRHSNRPIVAMEVFDKVPAKYPEPLLEYYRDVINSPADMAKMCVDEYGAEMISVRLEGTHPEKGNKSAEEAADVVKHVLESVRVPLIITGHSHFEKTNEVMKKVCEVTAGENCLINYVETDNYKTITAACIAYNHTVVAQSPIDVNLAKQLNILLTDMNFPREKIVMDPLTGTLGYGLEYTYSIMERIRIDGLAGDQMLAFPMLVNPGYETFRVKEARALDQDYPSWGNLGERGIYWETATAMSLLAAGAELLIMYHPKAVETAKKKIAEIYESGKGE
ncbi:MAG: acetyl-CoA decarbonylase/synthase complex subunit delta [Candidatus Aminicenantes bacterium]|nr:acetyl-CoA decarbonylase/synthase complex subunit delta [Candidatus Aminicenantes bacterium]MDH5385161.1 acetyl-CoA decarbonylase/synthase complex subunit delta [Candidatus Aminicenantes bacterium]MDH5742155.1 acetyl-CoA decarbonylase/synthase complex subunit delta [Candidatus Aminicenantes bacterium]